MRVSPPAFPRSHACCHLPESWAMGCSEAETTEQPSPLTLPSRHLLPGSQFPKCPLTLPTHPPVQTVPSLCPASILQNLPLTAQHPARVMLATQGLHAMCWWNTAMGVTPKKTAREQGNQRWGVVTPPEGSTFGGGALRGCP